MGTINTSIRLRTSDSLPSSLSLAANTVGTVDNFTEYGQMLVGPISDAIMSNNAGVLSTRLCGPKGAYIFVENPSTNKYPVKLYGFQQIIEEFAEQTYEGIESFATLQPGDSTLVPLSAQQGGVVAASTFDSCVIKYYIADRGGNFGKSAIVVSDNGSYYTYFVLDAELGEVLPSLGVPNYQQGKATTVPASWTFDYAEIVNDKGYILRFFDGGNADNQMRVFVDSRGEIVDTLTLDYGEFTYEQRMLDSRGYVIAYIDGDNTEIKIFDGDFLYQHTVKSSGFDIWNDWDYAAANGSFIVGFNDYLGGVGDYGVFVVNKDSKFLLSNLNYDSTGLYVDDCAVYGFGTFVFLSIWDNNNSVYNKFQIWNTNGTMLQEIDVAGNNFNSIEWTFYGTNKLQLIASDNTILSAHNEYLYNYNGTTDNFAETQFEIGDIYTNRKFYSYSKWITDSIRPWDYTWNSGQFEPESVVIAYYDIADTSGRQINIQVNNLSFVYMLDGDTEYTTYEYANTELKWLWLPNTGGGYYRFYTQKNSFVFNVSTGNDTSGAIQALTFSKAGQKLTTVISDLTAIGYEFAFKPVGDYVMYNWYTSGTDTTTYVMLYDEAGKGVRKDSVNIDGYQTYDGVWRMRFNTLLLRSWNYPSTRVWYFNTSANRFVELTNGGDAYSADKPYYSRHRFNKSVVTSGINDGNILLGPNSGYNVSAANENNNIRLLKKGLATKNVTIPETDGGWNLMLGSDMVIYWYQDPNNANCINVNVYDLDLNLVRVVELKESSFFDRPQMVGKRCYFRTAPDQYKYYMISSAGVAYMESDSAYNTNVVFNDYYWWDYQY